MVKNKASPDSAAHPSLRSLALFLSLCLSLTDAIHPEGTPGICWSWTLAVWLQGSFALDLHAKIQK